MTNESQAVRRRAWLTDTLFAKYGLLLCFLLAILLARVPLANRARAWSWPKLL